MLFKERGHEDEGAEFFEKHNETYFFKIATNVDIILIEHQRAKNLCTIFG
jgi:hypothetical protein